MKNEFNLRECICNTNETYTKEVGEVIYKDNVKEFIERLIPDTLIIDKKYDSNTVVEVIRILRERQSKLAGDELA